MPPFSNTPQATSLFLTPRHAPAAVAEKPSTALDAVLDKIASDGMGSLTVAEKLLLDEWSKRLREPNRG